MLIILNRNVIISIMLILKLTVSIEYFFKLKRNAYEIRLLSYWNKNQVASVRFVGFYDFKVINVTDASFKNYDYNYNIRLIFVPERKIILDVSFNVKSIKPFFKNYQVTLSFVFLNGIDVAQFELKSLLYVLYFYNSRFLSFNGQRPLDDAETCAQIHYPKSSYFENVGLFYLKSGCKYSPQTCKFIFKNASVENLYIYGLTRSFVKKNLIGFVPPHSRRLNASIRFATFFIYKLKLDESFPDSDVFEKTRIFIFRGEMDRMENVNFFKFESLHLIRYAIQEEE